MPLSISTNIAADKANYYLGYNSDKMQESIKRLASGKKTDIPRAGPWKLICFDEIECINQSIRRSDE